MSIPARLTPTLTALGLLAAIAPTARAGAAGPAGSHLWVVNEVFSSADGTVQFIELKECCGSPFERAIGGKPVFSLTQSYTFPADIPPPTSTANKHLLLATAAFAALPGAPTPDHVIQESFFSVTGDEVHWHIYPAATLAFGPSDLPLDGVLSLSQDLSVAPNSPTNFADQTGHVDLGPSVLHVAPCGNDAWSGLSDACRAPDGPKATIQAALDAAVDGDEVLVAPGTYVGPVDFAGKAVRLHSSHGAESTVVKGMVRCASGEGPGAVLEGFTVSRYPQLGRGMLCEDSEPTVQHCTFLLNEVVDAYYGGGAMEISGPRAPTLRHVTFLGNVSRGTYSSPQCGARGGGIHLRGAHLTVEACVFSKNLALGGCRSGPQPYGGAIFVEPHTGAYLTVLDSTFAGNVSEGPGAYSNAIFTSGVTLVRNCALGVDQYMLGAVMLSTCFGPQFVRDPAAGLEVTRNDGRATDFGDLRLRPASPCIDAGDNSVVPAALSTDCDGHPRFVDDCATPNAGVAGGAGGPAVVDMGAFEYQGSAGVERFCAAAPNSVGPGALLSWSGSVRVSANDLVLRAGPIAPGEIGFFFHGARTEPKPFGNGFLCTDGLMVRDQPLVADRSGTLQLALDYAGPLGTGIAPGATRAVQAWYRDHEDPAGFNLSDALVITFMP